MVQIISKINIRSTKIAAGQTASDRAEALYNTAQEISNNILAEARGGANRQYLINQIIESVQNQIGIGRYPAIVENFNRTECT